MDDIEYSKLKKIVPQGLVKEKWEDIPDTHVSVFHSTRLGNLEKVNQEGITPYRERQGEKNVSDKDKARMEFRKLTDEQIDAFSEESGYSFTRKDSFYCSPDPNSEWNKSDVILELKVNPQEVFVFDADLATAVSISWLRTEAGRQWLSEHQAFPPKGSREDFLKMLDEREEYMGDPAEYAQDYWLKGMKLKQFLALSGEEQQQAIKSPEILIPFKIDNKFLRLNK